MRAAVLLAALGLGACASFPDGEADRLAARVKTDLGTRPIRTQTDAVAAERAALLAAPLTQESAVAIALGANPRVRAAFERLGVARADALDAALPSGPLLKALRLRPDHDGPAIVHQAFGIDLLELLTLPASARAGQAGFSVARAEAAAEILAVAGAARAALIDYASARQTANLMAQAAETAAAARAAAEALYAAGNIAAVERDREALFAAEIAIADAAAQAALVPARERLAAALGLAPEDAAQIDAVARLPAPPETPIAAADAEARVLQASADLAITQGALTAARARRSASFPASLLSGLGLEGEREREDGETKEGLGLEWRPPLFDLGGAERLRAASTARRAEAMAEALTRELRAEARARLAEAEAARRIALARRDEILPLSAAVFEGAQKDFNAMEIGVFELLDAKRLRLDAGRAAILATRDYWQAQARLDLLLAGGRGQGAPADAPALPTAAAKPDH